MGAGRRRALWRPALIGVLLLVVGIGLVGWGLLPRDPEAAPLPAPFSVVPSADGSAGARSPAPPAMDPDTLVIPSLGVRAPLMTGSVAGGAHGRTLTIPDDPTKLTLYDKGATPCDPDGTVLIAGHVAYQGVHGTLWPLAGIAPHAIVYVSCADGTVSTWEVVAVVVTPQSDLSQEIFTDAGPLRMELITCGGPVTPAGHYSDNLRVELVRASLSQG